MKTVDQESVHIKIMQKRTNQIRSQLKDLEVQNGSVTAKGSQRLDQKL